MAGEPFNIMFTCAGRRVALLLGFRQALAELGLEGRLVATDVTPAAAALHAADAAEIVPQVRTLHYIPRLKELAAAHGIRLLVPLTDLDLRTLARHAGEFAQLGCTVMIAPAETVSLCRHKLKFNSHVQKAGLRAVRSLDLRHFRQRPFYPCFVKPIHGSAAVGTGCIRSERELKAHIATFGSQLLIQDYVIGQEFTIDVFRRRDGVVCAAVPRQRLSIRAGEVEKALTVKDDQLIAAAVKLAQSMPGFWGVLNAQCRRPEGGEPHFFEVNPRFGGGVPLTLAAGVNLPKFVIMEVLGQQVPPAIGEFTEGLLMLRYDDAIFTQASNPTRLPGFKEPLSR